MSERRNWLRPGVAAGVAVALIVALVVGAVAFSIARRTANVADVGTEAIFEEASLSAAAASRNRVVQAHLMASAGELGLATMEDVEDSLQSADDALAELNTRIERLGNELEEGELVDLPKLADDFETTGALSIAAIRDGMLEEAEALITDELEPSYQALAKELAAARNAAVSQMSLSQDAAGRLGDAASLLVILLLPISFLLIYRARVKSQQRRRDLESSLEKQQAIADTKDEFIANLSHELRTPLTGIYGFALELIDGSHDPAISIELARLIAGQSAELSRMVEDLLALNTAEHNELIVNLENVDPAAEIEDVLEPLARTGVIAVSQAESATVRVDALRLRQIVRNLISNANRHGGPHVRVLGASHGSTYTIEVRDDGKGVPAELEGKLFTRFIHEGTTPLITGSVGLGLSIASLLTERMGGRIAYRREDGETVFAVSFPLANEMFRDEDPAPVAGAMSFVEGFDYA